MTLKVREYDYTVHQHGTIVGVKDDKEYPISVEEYKRAYPEHKDVGCEECIFVKCKRALLGFFIDRDIKVKATEEPTLAGKYTMPGWRGHSSFYVFKCKECDKLSTDYPHGYRGRYLYLKCDNCGDEIILTNPQYYKEDGLAVPETRELSLRLALIVVAIVVIIYFIPQIF